MKITIEIGVGVIRNLIDISSCRYWADEIAFEPKRMRLHVIESGDNETNPLEVLLNKAALKAGLALMAVKEPRAFASVLDGSYSPNTGDMFVQMCVFGEIKYG